MTTQFEEEIALYVVLTDRLTRQTG